MHASITEQWSQTIRWCISMAKTNLAPLLNSAVPHEDIPVISYSFLPWPLYHHWIRDWVSPASLDTQNIWTFKIQRSQDCICHSKRLQSCSHPSQNTCHLVRLITCTFPGCWKGRSNILNNQLHTAHKWHSSSLLTGRAIFPLCAHAYVHLSHSVLM